MYATMKCVFCGSASSNTNCQSCNVASRIEKFSCLLDRFGTASNSICYHDEIVALVGSSWQVREKDHIGESRSGHPGSQFGRATPLCAGAII